MGSIVANLGEAIAAQIGGSFALTKITAPNTSILNRALCVDPSQDMLPRYGTTRYQFGYLQQMLGEIGPAITFAPSGQLVQKPMDDFFDQVRFVGSWTGSAAPTNGTVVFNANSQTGEYIEIVFYGTDFTLLADPTTTGTMTWALDGGSATTFSFTPSTTLSGGVFSVNVPIVLVKGTSLGLHTIILSCTGSSNAISLTGYEIGVTPATAANLTYVAGSAYQGSSKFTLAANTTDPYNSNFASVLGTAGTRGGHVVVYANQGGTLAKAIQYTDTTQTNLTSVTHANEEVINQFGWREFGRGGSSDFSTLSITNGSARAFALSDNSHSLKVGPSIQALSPGSAAVPTDVIILTSISEVLTFVFVGTGLDVMRQDGTQAGTSDTISVTVDGTNIGNMTTIANQQARIEKIVSGLPYGSHSVAFTRTVAATDRVGFKSFITYGPKKPSVPSGAIEVCDYFITATYAFGLTTQATQDPPSVGVISKTPFRDVRYSNNSWAVAVSVGAGNRSGLVANTTSIGQAVTYVFWGTGFEWGSTQGSGAANITVSIDGANYTGAASVAPVASSTWTPGTSILNTGTNTRFAVTGLALGYHTVTFTYTSGSNNFLSQYFDEITPIHSPRNAPLGSKGDMVLLPHYGIADNRKFTNFVAKPLANWAQCVGATVYPTATTAGGLVPMPDMYCRIKTNGNPIEITYSAAVYCAANGQFGQFKIYVDGVAADNGDPKYSGTASSTGSDSRIVSDSVIVPVGPGVHFVQVFWGGAGAGATVTAYSNMRNMHVREIS